MLITSIEIIKNSWKIYQKNFRALVPYMLILIIPNFVLGATGIMSLFLDQFTKAGIWIMLNNLTVVAIVIASALFSLWANIALVKTIKEIILGKEVIKLKQGLNISSHLIWPAIVTSLLVILIILGGTILLIIPGIIFSLWYTFAYYVIILEEKTGMNALRESKKMVYGRWWEIFFRLFLPGIFFGLILMIINSIATNLTQYIFHGTYSALISKGLLLAAINSIAIPLSALTTILLYLSARENPVMIIPKPSTTPDKLS
jgi:hypothetical protein